MNATPTRPTHLTHGLVHPLPAGPLDFVADIHGEIDALLALLAKLGYDTDGHHPEGRQLVFLGDLVDRGPDSPGVVELVRGMVEAGRAQAVIGNHELNIMLGKCKQHNAWIMAPEAADTEKPIKPSKRTEFLAFFASLPLALERHDIRAVHAAWDDTMIIKAKGARTATALYHRERELVADHIASQKITDPVEQSLAHQNLNLVKHLTSGPEKPANERFELEGRIRGEERYPWWHDYTGEAFVVFGHYWRKTVDPEKKPLTDRVFGNTPLYALTGPNTTSIDYSVGARAYERRTGKTKDFDGELAALRWPERELVFDHGNIIPLSSPQPA